MKGFPRTGMSALWLALLAGCSSQLDVLPANAELVITPDAVQVPEGDEVKGVVCAQDAGGLGISDSAKVTVTADGAVNKLCVASALTYGCRDFKFQVSPGATVVTVHAYSGGVTATPATVAIVPIPRAIDLSASRTTVDPSPGEVTLFAKVLGSEGNAIKDVNVEFTLAGADGIDTSELGELAEPPKGPTGEDGVRTVTLTVKESLTVTATVVLSCESGEENGTCVKLEQSVDITAVPPAEPPADPPALARQLRRDGICVEDCEVEDGGTL